MNKINKNKLIYQKSLISYSIVKSSILEKTLVNYLNFKEINFLINSNLLNYHSLVFIYLIETEENFKNKKFGTKALHYFLQLFSSEYPIILFCENNYKDFDLINWYNNSGFIKIYDNLESSLLMLKPPILVK